MANGEVVSELKLKPDEVEWLRDLGEQECWICGRAKTVEGRRLAIDHDHVTGAVRGLLCTSCNRRLGNGRNSEWYRRAAEYLDVAARAFGDACEKCRQPTARRRISTENNVSRYQHSCCGKRWIVGYQTRGFPFAWNFGANPIPPEREFIDVTDEWPDPYPEHVALKRGKDQ